MLGPITSRHQHVAKKARSQATESSRGCSSPVTHAPGRICNCNCSIPAYGSCPTPLSPHTRLLNSCALANTSTGNLPAHHSRKGLRGTAVSLTPATPPLLRTQQLAPPPLHLACQQLHTAAEHRLGAWCIAIARGHCHSTGRCGACGIGCCGCPACHPGAGANTAWWASAERGKQHRAASCSGGRCAWLAWRTPAEGHPGDRRPLRSTGDPSAAQAAPPQDRLTRGLTGPGAARECWSAAYSKD
jgi:hypothetical protein